MNGVSLAYRKTARTEARKAANRRRLLEVARALVAEGGFQNVQIATVAEVAGVAAGTVYRYFPSKAALCAEVFRSVCDREIAITEEAAVAEGATSERLAAAVRAFASRALRGRTTAYALLGEPVDPAVDAERLVYRRALGRVFEGVVAAGVARRELPAQNAEVTGACIAGAVMESLINPLAPDAGATDSETMLDAIVLCCLRAAGARRDAP